MLALEGQPRRGLPAWAAHLIFTINGIPRTNGPTRRSTAAATTESTRGVITPVSTTLPIGTVSSHVSGVATHATDDVGREVALLGAIILAMPDLAAYRSVSSTRVKKRKKEGNHITYSSDMLDSHRREACRSAWPAHAADCA